MYLSERQELILSKLEESVSPDHLSSSPFLVSQICPQNRIIATAIASSLSLLKVNAGNSEIIYCCRCSRFADVVQNVDRFSIVRSFAVVPSILIVPGVTETVNEFHGFIRSIHGNDRSQSFLLGEALALHFEQVGDVMAVWSALRILPFRAKCVWAWVNSIDIRGTQENEGKQKKITLEPKSKFPPIVWGRQDAATLMDLFAVGCLLGKGLRREARCGLAHQFVHDCEHDRVMSARMTALLLGESMIA
jgi:hypothetical protein